MSGAAERMADAIEAAALACGLCVTDRVATAARYWRGREEYGSGAGTITAPEFDGLRHAREELLDAHNYIAVAAAHGQMSAEVAARLLAANAAVLRLLAEVRGQ
jgi:hypothetical protein